MKAKEGTLLKAVSLLCVFVLLLVLLSGMLVGCSCKHEYVNGTCSICGYVCEHKQYEEYGNYGKCIECGSVCRHKEYEDGVCTECRRVCNHTRFDDGICTTCGYECEHEYDSVGNCEVCGIRCTHNFEGTICTICGADKFVDPNKPEASYNYVAHLDEQLPRIYVQSSTFMTDANRYVPTFDNYMPENNIDWQYHDCTITVNNCAQEYELSATAGIKIRGNWTTTYPKKPFRIKFDKKQAMLGLNGGAKMKSWVLLADYKDCSLERNSAAFYLGQQILGSDGYYCSDFRQVEVYLNNQYWGVYLLAEQQQVNENRINITEAEENYTGTDIGYFVEYDGYNQLEVYNERFSSNHGEGYTIKSDVYVDENYQDYGVNNWNPSRYPQKNFIKNYINNLYTLCSRAVGSHLYYTFNADFTALVPYTPKTSEPVYETISKVIDVQSLVDTYILNEIACDADLGWSSFFMDVDFGPNAKDNLLRFEAPWDFDSSLGFKTQESGVGLYAASSGNPWLSLFIKESWFQTKIQDKWHEMYDAGVQQNTLKFLKTLKTNYSEAYQRNFNKWGFIVNDEATEEVKQTVHNNDDAVNQLIDWITVRFSYLNSIWL